MKFVCVGGSTGEGAPEDSTTYIQRVLRPRCVAGPPSLWFYNQLEGPHHTYRPRRNLYVGGGMLRGPQHEVSRRRGQSQCRNTSNKTDRAEAVRGLGPWLIHDCFIHLGIVHQTVGPAWMNHLTNCPVYHFDTVTDCPPVFEWFNRWFVAVKRWMPNCLASRVL